MKDDEGIIDYDELGDLMPDMPTGRRGSECWRKAMSNITLQKRSSLTPVVESDSSDSEEPDTPPAIPHLSDARIELQHLIGKGGYGEVIKANKDKRELAVKKLVIINDNEAEDARDEIMALMSCQGPHILRFYGVYEDLLRTDSGGLRVNIVTELLEGTVYKLADEVFDQKYVLPFIAHSCLKGLDYMNLCGFAHLDIKAGNIGYDEFGRIKILDFGFCSPMGRKVQLRGTLGYVAPELLKNCQEGETHRVTGKEDIFSLGCTMYSVMNNHYTPYEPRDLLGMGIELDKEEYDDILRERTMGSWQVNCLDLPTSDDTAKAFLSACLQKLPHLRKRAKDLLSDRWFEDLPRRGPSPLMYEYGCV